MHKREDRFIYSPADLIPYIESPLLTWFRRYEVEFPGRIPKNAKDEVLTSAIARIKSAQTQS